MKKFVHFLLVILILCSLFSLTCVSAYAANYTTNYSSYTAPSSSDSAHNGGKNSGTTTSEVKWMQAALNF